MDTCRLQHICGWRGPCIALAMIGADIYVSYWAGVILASVEQCRTVFREEVDLFRNFGEVVHVLHMGVGNTSQQLG